MGSPLTGASGRPSSAHGSVGYLALGQAGVCGGGLVFRAGGALPEPRDHVPGLSVEGLT